MVPILSDNLNDEGTEPETGMKDQKALKSNGRKYITTFLWETEWYCNCSLTNIDDIMIWQYLTKEELLFEAT